MSASLVGSEMCIRDSLLANWTSIVKPPSRQTVKLNLPLPCPLGRASAGSRMNASRHSGASGGGRERSASMISKSRK
eukprot:4696798-Alexandrium_andersonii.AAC.1